MDVKIKNSWDSITIKEYQQIISLESSDFDDEIDQAITLLSIVSNESYKFWEEANYEDFIKASALLSFLSDPPKPSDIKHKYTIGDQTYNITNSIPELKKCPIQYLKSIQYIGLNQKQGQFSEMSTFEQTNKIHEILAIMLIPEGQHYGVEGYSVSKNAEHLREHMNITDALSVSAFFLLLFEALITGLSDSLEKEMMTAVKNGMITKTEMQKILRAYRESLRSNHLNPLWKNGDGNT